MLNFFQGCSTLFGKSLPFFMGQMGDFTSIPITNFPSPNSIWWPGILILQFQYIPLYIYIYNAIRIPWYSHNIPFLYPNYTNYIFIYIYTLYTLYIIIYIHIYHKILGDDVSYSIKHRYISFFSKFWSSKMPWSHQLPQRRRVTSTTWRRFGAWWARARAAKNCGDGWWSVAAATAK